MKNHLVVNVKLWNEVVGALYWDSEKEAASFQYYPSFLRSQYDISPLVMPLSRKNKDKVYQFLTNRNNCFKGLPGLVADSLPDNYGNTIIDEWFASHGLPNEQITPLDRLCYIGVRGMGALEFEPNQSIKGLDVSTRLYIDELVSFADEIFRNRQNFRERLIQQDRLILDIVKIGTSAGGAKPKAIIAWNAETNEVRSGQVKAPEGFSYWLLKFDGTEFSEHEGTIKHPKGIGNIEYAYYRMAIDCGIEMMESRLLEEKGSFHFMTRRYDRHDDGSKIHVQTLAAMAHYDKDVRHSYEEMFSVLRTLKLDYNQQEQLYRRMVFNVVARNHDDHTKNHAFLMDKDGQWRLGPAYDMCYSYVPGGQWTDKHQMSLNHKRDNFTFDDLVTVGERVGISRPHEIIEEIVGVVSEWRRYADECGVHDNHKEYIASKLLLLTPQNN